MVPKPEKEAPTSLNGETKSKDLKAKNAYSAKRHPQPQKLNKQKLTCHPPTSSPRHCCPEQPKHPHKNDPKSNNPEHYANTITTDH